MYLLPKKKKKYKILFLNLKKNLEGGGNDVQRDTNVQIIFKNPKAENQILSNLSPKIIELSFLKDQPTPISNEPHELNFYENLIIENTQNYEQIANEIIRIMNNFIQTYENNDNLIKDNNGNEINFSNYELPNTDGQLNLNNILNEDYVNFFETINNNILDNLANVANFFGIEPLVNLLALHEAFTIKHMNEADIKNSFGIPTDVDFTQKVEIDFLTKMNISTITIEQINKLRNIKDDRSNKRDQLLNIYEIITKDEFNNQYLENEKKKLINKILEITDFNKIFADETQSEEKINNIYETYPNIHFLIPR